MAYTWQTPLKWGTLVAVGLAITGTTIYTVKTKQDIDAVEMIELVEGIKERASVVNQGLTTTGDQITPIVSRDQLQWVMNYAKTLVPQFVDPSTNVNKVTGAPVMLTVTGLWHTLQIGDGTNKWTISPCWTNANSVVHPAVYGNILANGNPFENGIQVVYKETFIECYKVLHALSNTTRVAVWTNSIGLYGATGGSADTPYLFPDTPNGPDPDVFSPLPMLTWGAPNAWINSTYPSWGAMSTEDMKVPEWLQHPDTYTYFWDLTTAASIATQYVPAATAPIRYGLASYRYYAHGFYGWNIQMIFDNTPFGPCWSIGDPWPSEPGCLSTWMWDGPYAFKECTSEYNTNKYNLITSMLVVGTGTNDLSRSVQFWGKTETVFQVLDTIAAEASDIFLSGIITPSEFSNPEGGDDTPWNVLARTDQATGPNDEGQGTIRYEYDNNAANSIDISPVHTETKTVTKGPAIITWTFERCTEALP